MKGLFILLLSLGAMNLLAAENAKVFKCHQKYSDNDINVSAGMFFSGFSGECLDRDKKSFRIHMDGVTLGWRYSNQEYFSIICPTMQKKMRKNSELSLSNQDFHGARMAASIGAGVDVGYFKNKALGTCFLSGLQVKALGASAGYMELWIDQI
jgi:hypothetical protein